MQRNSAVDRLEAMRVFVTVAEKASFAAAARGLGLSAPAVTRAVAGLEDRIGTPLLRRTTRIVRVTEAGERYLADCRRILSEIEDAEASAAGDHAEPRGMVAVTAPVLFGRLFVAPIVVDFLARHAGASVRLLLADRVVDLLEERIDVAVRIAHLADSSSSAVRVGAVRRVVCAAPAYLSRRGVPRSVSDLAEHDAIAFTAGSTPAEWTFGDGQTVRPRARLQVNGAEVAIDAAIAGHGLTRVLSYQVAAHVAARRLRLVLEDAEPPPIPIHLVHHEGRRASARVRAFLDVAAERLRADVDVAARRRR
jgi:DNA-binding transcriptional LysR family regulator